MSTQLDQIQPIDVVNTSDFIQTFVMLKNGLPFDLTGLTEAEVDLLQKDNQTVSSFKYSTSDITIVGDPKLGQLQLTIRKVKTLVLRVSDGKDLDFQCTGPWGDQTFRAKAILSIKQPSLGK